MSKDSRDRVLIADDNEANVELLEAYLSDMDVETAVAVDGQDTLDKAASFEPHLILLDVMMPKLSGFDVCQRAKHGLGLADVYIVLLTAKGQEFDRQRGQEVGADLYMTKPFDPDALLDKARTVLGL